ncbi:chemotaxis protein CheX [Pseudobacteriovorax antillogorgiicola]|uniref:Chemotaxis phosphatase CheX n=1 Tax=Pseudobacteriovorax antillogorgiicola TaxID=1513793 RepID=A0A1Y6BYU6_9BACT|nr:chemotaxis protein CheX [Pseudobacteriovorax antillogorgiicola]TCS51257.1 chemotaxis phosphatase CheX-like protein [Pseudobacteriovorax antillogorgiicola]SMF36455.1 Chemotaxis phosphatase CheX [Pseudobacteriovorax antillogorgiicola]
MSEATDITTSEDRERTVENLRTMIRGKVLSTLTKSARLEESRIVEVENTDDFVYGHWMAFILISGSSVRVTLKLHFSNRTAKIMLGNKVKNETDKDKLERISMDFMKEQCNLMAGALKTTFNNSKIITGLSIPLVTRGFDEAVFSDKLDHGKINDVWRLTWGQEEGDVICSSVTEVLQWSDFNGFSYEEVDEDDDEGVFL